MYLCPAEYKSLFQRSISSDVTSTADSFKSWDTCMDNTTCKVVVIVLIVLGGLLFFWVVSTLIRCLCMGFLCLEALCCCCCRGAHRNRYVEPAMQPQNNPNMYPVRQAQPVYLPYDEKYSGYRPLY